MVNDNYTTKQAMPGGALLNRGLKATGTALGKYKDLLLGRNDRILNLKSRAIDNLRVLQDARND